MKEKALFDGNWRKSTRSDSSGDNCVEVAITPGVVGVRDTKRRDGGTLVLSREQWADFVAAVKSGELD